MSNPPMPVNARLRIGDRTIPLELVYKGRDDWGCHVWIAPVTYSADLRSESISLTCDELPGKTIIMLEVERS
jgi:hypothetical protein